MGADSEVALAGPTRLASSPSGLTGVLRAAASESQASPTTPRSAVPSDGTATPAATGGGADVDRLLDRFVDRLEFEIVRAYGDEAGP